MIDASSFRARGRTVVVERPAVMGIVNASPESFSGDGSTAVDAQAAVAEAQFAAGARIVDLGGQSANTKTPELSVDEESARLVPLIDAIRERTDGLLSIDTYKPAVADACLAAGADIINDVSALHDPILAEVVARWDAGFVLMHTVGPPKVKILDPDLYDDVVDDVVDFGRRTIARLADAGVDAASVVFDPGIDFAKTPGQSIDLLARAGELAALGRPLLYALSRKDFIGALTGTGPRERDPGTLAAVAAVAAATPHCIVRVHRVAETVQFLAVLDALGDPSSVAADLHLREDLRRTPTS